MSLESGKTLGGIGALLMVIGTFVPFLGLVGLILLFVALKRMGDYYKESGIFQNALYGLIFGIIGIVSLAVVVLALFGLSIIPAVPDFADSLGFLAFLGGIIVALVVAFIFYILTAVFFRRSFNMLSEKTGETMFGTAGLLLLIGAILTIIVVGLVLIFIAWILVTVAFFSIKTSTVQPSASEAPPPPPPS